MTKGGDCDQQLIARLHAINTPGDPSQLAGPSHISSQGRTNAYHGQVFMQERENEEWYDRVQAKVSNSRGTLRTTH